MSDKDIGFFWAKHKLLNVTWMTGINTVIVNQKEKVKLMVNMTIFLKKLGLLLIRVHKSMNH